MICLALLAGALMAAEPAVSAEPGQPPVRSFDGDDGLASSHVGRIVPDSKGFLWFCGAKGLSRFDGVRFVRFGAADGLAGQVVVDIVEEPGSATYWVGTNEGLFRFVGDRPAAPGRLFERVDLPIGSSVRRLLLDRAGRLWVGTSEGLAVLEPGREGFGARRIEPQAWARDKPIAVYALVADPSGAIWAGTHDDGVCRIAPDLSGTRCYSRDLAGLFFIRDLIVGPDGRIWCTFLGGVARFHAEPETRSNPVSEIFDHRSGLPSIDTSDLLADPAGEILVGSSAGVARLIRNDSGTWRVSAGWTTKNGLTSDLVLAMALDPADNLWIGTSTRGAFKVAHSGFRRFPEVEEGASLLAGLIDDGEGGMVALAAIEQRRYRLHRLTASAHTAFDVRLPRGISYLGWGAPRILRDHDGSFWVATGQGLLRYRGHGGARRLESPPDEVYGLAQGLPGVDVFSLFADSRGGIWVSVSGPVAGKSSVARRLPGAEAFSPLPPTVGGEPGDLGVSFAEDAAGTVWIAFASGRVVRQRRGGAFETVTLDPPLAPTGGFHLAFDSRHRLWIVSRGAVVADDPSADTVRTRPGPQVLRDAAVSCVVDDDTGRLYFGTDRGVLRLDEAHDATRRFTPADGLPGDSIMFCGRSASGLWFGDAHGVARLEPAADLQLPPPQVRIASVRIDGQPLPLAPLGAQPAGPLELRLRPRHVAVEFFAISHASGERLLFQHRFDRDEDWSVPTESGMLEFPRLSTGRHRLSIRALPTRGEAAPPAVLELVVPAPVWQRPWFLALALAATMAGVVLTYRARLARAVALERIRTRIATDLHDDVGADLSRILLLAEFARRDIDEEPTRAGAMLAEVSSTARDAVINMSDIVWALKRGNEQVAEVIARVRDYAAPGATRAGVALNVEVGQDLEGVVLAGELRRELYLLLKEAVTNALRHAGARTVELTIRSSGRGLVATLRDDGCGFRPEAPRKSRGGHGLVNMRSRVEALGGALQVESAPGRGTTLRFDLPRA